MTAPNHDKANLIIGVIFAKLLKEWPNRVNFSAADVLPMVIDPPSKGDIRTFSSLMGWLAEEDYLRFTNMHQDGLFVGVVLSEHGLRTLNAIPEGISDRKSYAEKIVEEAGDVSKEGAKKAIADFIGQMVGGVIKSVSSG